MTAYRYVIDTSSLIDLGRNSPRDIFPTLWSNVEMLVENSTLISPQEVLLELKESDDPVTNWAIQLRGFFREPTHRQFKLLREILNSHPIVKNDGKYDADPWLIALALEESRQSQETLIPTESIIVTEEKMKATKVNIPFVCQQYGVQTVTLFDMFRREGWSF